MMEIHCKECGGNKFARREEMYICTGCGREYSAFEVIELTDDVISNQKTFESKKGSITENTKDFHPKKPLSYYESAFKRNPNDFNAQLNIIYLKADKAKVTEIIPYIRKMTNISPKILKSIRDSQMDEDKEMEAIWEVGGVFQITAVTFKNSGDANTRKMANDAYAQRVNKEWYLRILELTKLFFTFGDDLERVFDGKYNDLAVNSYKTGIWYYLDIIKLAEDQEVHIKKIRNYEEKIRLVEPDFEELFNRIAVNEEGILLWKIIVQKLAFLFFLSFHKMNLKFSF